MAQQRAITRICVQYLRQRTRTVAILTQGVGERVNAPHIFANCKSRHLLLQTAKCNYKQMKRARKKGQDDNVSSTSTKSKYQCSKRQCDSYDVLYGCLPINPLHYPFLKHMSKSNRFVHKFKHKFGPIQMHFSQYIW